MEWQREGEGERDMGRQTPGEKLARQKEKVPLRNEICTTEHVISGKGESNDSHSPLALRQACIHCIKWDISNQKSIGTGADRVI